MSRKIIDDVGNLTSPKSMMGAIDDNTEELYNNMATIKNPGTAIYIKGDETTNGSIRFYYDDNRTILQQRLEGIWSGTSLESGADAFWVGKGLGIGAAGGHMVTKASDGHYHFHAHNKFSAGLSIETATIINAYSFLEKSITQSDDSGVFLGTTLGFQTISPNHVLLNKGYFRTDTIAATEPVRLRIWSGVDNTGILIFDQSYPASIFSALIEGETELTGLLEFTNGSTYFTQYDSDAIFSLKMNGANTHPWSASDLSLIHEDDILQTTEWISGDTFDKGQWSVQDKKTYICNTTGVQTGTFAGNITLWDLLSFAENVPVENTIEYLYLKGNASTNDSIRFAVDATTLNATLQKRVSGTWEESSQQSRSFDLNTTLSESDHKPGRISYDLNNLTVMLDTGITGVRIQAGQEEYYLVYNNTESVINNGKACFASGVDTTNNVLTVGLADNSSFQTSAQILGLATHNIQIDSLGLVTTRGIVRDFDTTHLSFGLTYLGTSGNMTSIKPLYPATRNSMGALLKSGVGDGIFQVGMATLMRRNASKSYTFTSADAAAGTHYRAGFYDWSATSVTLNQGLLSIIHGSSGESRAGHIGIVASAAGVVDTGQVGIQVTGTLDSELGTQTSSQTAIITDDITTLTLDVMEETLEKFSGEVTISLYVVSGSPTAYSVTFNYGFSKYEDFSNIDGTIAAFEIVWEAGAADVGFNVSLKHHKSIGWSYAASGFEPGNSNICDRLVDQAIESDISTGIHGAYKRVDLNQFINGSEKEGIIIEIKTNSTRSIRNMDLHVNVFSEELF